MTGRRLMGMTYNLYDPASRFRFKQFLPFFRGAGWEVLHRTNRPDRLWQSRIPLGQLRSIHNRIGLLAMGWNRWLDIREANECDVVFISKDIGPGRDYLRDELIRRNPRVVYDFDDAVFLGSKEDSVRWMCERSAWVTPGNEYLAHFARQYTDRVTVVPTVVDTEGYRPEPRESGGPIRIGWSGSDQSIRDTLLPHLSMLARIQREVDFDLVIITNTRPSISEPELRWSFRPWTEADEVAGLQSLDIGLMPLVDTEFQRGKCGLKLLQYMATGTPAIGSPVGVNRQIVDHGRTGFLASSDEEWAEGIVALARDPALRVSMGLAARRRCVEEYSIHRWGPVLLGVFDQVAASGISTEPGTLERRRKCLPAADRH